MRIVQMCFSLAAGGLERSVINMTKEFARRGYASACICPKGSFIEKALRESAGAEVEVLSVPNRFKYVDVAASYAIHKFLRPEDRLVLHSLRDIWIVYPAVFNMPSVRVFGFCRMFIRDINKKDWLHTLLYRRFERLICLAEAQKQELLNCLPVAEDTCVVIPNGIDTYRFSPGPKPLSIRQEWGVDARALVFGYAGRLDPQKGVLELIEAMPRVPDAELVIVGNETFGQTGYLQKLKERARQMRLESRVHFVPEREDIHDVMRAFDVFVMPSYEEAFGKVLVEAMATGLPCIATAAGGPPEILRGGQLGLLVKPRSVDSLADALAQMADSVGLRERLGRESRAVAESQYAVDVVYKKLEKLFV